MKKATGGAWAAGGPHARGGDGGWLRLLSSSERAVIVGYDPFTTTVRFVAGSR
jgi:hypothetical protein